jgi:hypothetical protein
MSMPRSHEADEVFGTHTLRPLARTARSAASAGIAPEHAPSCACNGVVKAAACTSALSPRWLPLTTL